MEELFKRYITKTTYSVLAGLAIVLGIAACGGDDEKESIEFAVTPITTVLNNDGTATVNVKSGAEWSITMITENWLTASPQSGKGNGTVTLKAATDTKSTRTAQVVFTESGTSKTVVVTVSQQPPLPKLETDKSSLSFTSAAGEATVQITSNQTWTIESNDTWCKVSPRTGSGNGSMKVEVTQNATLTPRSTTIIIKPADSSLQSITLQVNQDGVAFTVSPLNVTLDENYTSTISIKTTSRWSITNISDSWLTVSPVSGNGDATVTLKAVGPNNSKTTRTVDVEITENSASLVQTVKVSQLPAPPTLRVDKDELSFSCNEGKETIEIASNIGWTVTSSASWCTVSPRQGNDNGTITVQVTANEALTARTTNIIITPDDTSLSPITIPVKQKEYVEVKPGENDNTTPQYSRKK